VRHLWFGLGLIVALVAALPMLGIVAMNECQLHATQELADRCFARSGTSWTIYLASLSVVALAAIGLHLANKRWAWLALIAVPIVPFAAVLVAGL
jgi:hypothetical protein